MKPITTADTPLQIALAVHGNPEAPSHLSAQRFITAALTRGMAIVRVFFYYDAVLIAQTDWRTGEGKSAQSNWIELHRNHDLELCICIGAATRRGIIEPPGGTRPEFETVGLGQLIDAVVQADRFITFPA